MSKGIDIPIDKLVAEFGRLLWVGFNNSFNGRVFRNERFENFQSKISPEIHQSGTDVYLEALKDYSSDGQCFFDVQPNIETIGSVYSADVWICFMVNLKTVYPALNRIEATEQAHIDTSELINNSPFNSSEMITGFQGFIGYDWGENADQARADMSPHYLFRYTTKINYTIC